MTVGATFPVYEGIRVGNVEIEKEWKEGRKGGNESAKAVSSVHF